MRADAARVLRHTPSCGSSLRPGRILGGEIRLKLDDGFIDLADRDMSGSELRDIRGKEESMVFQEPMTSLSPVPTIGNQIRETIYLHRTRDKKEAIRK